jgi:hypothetical protein
LPVCPRSVVANASMTRRAFIFEPLQPQLCFGFQRPFSSNRPKQGIADPD